MQNFTSKEYMSHEMFYVDISTDNVFTGKIIDNKCYIILNRYHIN
jgi:hypothetical protein